MAWRMRISFVVAALLLGACAGKPYPVHSYGPDTYVVFVDSRSAAKASRAAIDRANEYCSANGLYLMPDQEQPVHRGVRLTFRCLAKGDPDLRRPQMRPPPDTVIEDRRK